MGRGEWEKVERVKYTKSPPILNETLLLVQCMSCSGAGGVSESSGAIEGATRYPAT